MKKLQAEGLTGKAFLAAVRSNDEVVVFEGDQPVARVMPVRVELKKRESYFRHYPHDASECFHTCWRHDGTADAEAADEAVDEPVAAAT